MTRDMVPGSKSGSESVVRLTSPVTSTHLESRNGRWFLNSGNFRTRDIASSLGRRPEQRFNVRVPFEAQFTKLALQDAGPLTLRDTIENRLHQGSNGDAGYLIDTRRQAELFQVSVYLVRAAVLPEFLPAAEEFDSLKVPAPFVIERAVRPTTMDDGERASG